MSIKSLTLISTAISIALVNPVAYAQQEKKNSPDFGGPDSPQGQIIEAQKEITPAFRFPAIDKAFTPWVKFKQDLAEEHGFNFSGHYATMYQYASGVDQAVIDKNKANGIDDSESAFSGNLRLNASWTAFGRGTANTGTFSIIADNRHSFADQVPGGFGNYGYHGITGTNFGDFDGNFKVITLTYGQKFNNGNTGILIGNYDPNDYQTALGYASPWTVFSNMSIVLDPSVALPDASWGIAAGHWFNDSFYVQGGVNDANGTGDDSLEFFEEGAELYKWGHVGWTPSKDQRYFKNVHASAWHTDEREAYNNGAGQEAVYGMTFAANWTFDDTIMPFMRAGWSEGNHDFFNKSLTAGVIYHLPYRSDLMGFAANWADKSEPINYGEDAQVTAEAFYRLQVSQNFALTPSLQALVNPGGEADRDTVYLFNIRARLTF